MDLTDLCAALVAVSRQPARPPVTLGGDDRLMIESFLAAGPLAAGEERDVLCRDGGLGTAPPAELVAIRDWIAPQVAGMFELEIRRGECFGPIPPWYLVARRIGGAS